MDNAKKVMASAIFTVFLTACDSNEQASRNVRVASDQVALVSSFWHGDQREVSIFIGPNEYDFFDITLERVNVEAGYSVVDKRNHIANFSITANWGGEHYIQSAHPATYTTFTIHSLTATEAVIELSANLLSMASGKFLALSPSTVKIEGELLKELVAMD